MHVLIVEPHPEGLELASMVVRELGHSIAVCTSGEQALALVLDQGQAFDAIVVDEPFASTAGHDASRMIRSNPATADLPILCVAPGAGEHHVPSAHPSACDGYVSRPFDAAQLRDVLDRVVETRVPKAPGVRVLVVEDDPGAAELLANRLALIGASWSLASSAAEALELVAREAFDVAVVDLKLATGRMEEGLELIQALQAEPRTAVVRILVHSVHVGAVALPPGVRQLAKPFKLRDLAALVGGTSPRQSGAG